jgi:hypothetical protein
MYSVKLEIRKTKLVCFSINHRAHREHRELYLESFNSVLESWNIEINQ